MRCLTILHSLFIHIHTVVPRSCLLFLNEDTILFLPFLINHYIHTFACVFEVIITFKVQFSFRFRIFYTFFKFLHFKEDDPLIQLFK
jgi:uncharacterized membrane protein